MNVQDWSWDHIGLETNLFTMLETTDRFSLITSFKKREPLPPIIIAVPLALGVV